MKVVYISGTYRGDKKPDTIYNNIQMNDSPGISIAMRYV